MHVYQDRAAFARRLLHTDRYLTPERADFLGKHLGIIGDGENKAGQRRHGIIWNGDPVYRAGDFSPDRHRLFEAEQVGAGRDSWIVRDFATHPGDREARRACFANLDEQWIENTDHMLHHDQPAEVARIIEAAFAQGGAN